MTDTRSTADRIAALLAKPVLSRAEIVEVSGLSKATVIRAQKAGDLPVSRIGDRVLSPTTAAMAWLTGEPEAEPQDAA